MASDRVPEMVDFVNINELAGISKKEVKEVKTPDVDAQGSAVSEEGSRRIPIHVPNVAPPPPIGGKYTPLAPPPRTLEWGCTPTVLSNWFKAWEEFWQVNWMENTAGEKQLLNLVKIDLSKEWRNTLSDYDWDAGSMHSLYKLMNLSLSFCFCH